MQVQCLHCSEHVCLECAQKHVNLVAQESDGAMHLLNEKLDVLDRIATNTRQKIVAERDKIVKQADVERDRSFALLAQMIEEEKQQIRNKNKELNELPLNEIPIFIQQLKSDVQHLIDKNDSFFVVNSSAPQITLNRQNERRNTRIRLIKRLDGSKFDDDDDEYNSPRQNNGRRGIGDAIGKIPSRANVINEFDDKWED
jgi:hypothetical protein